MFFRRHPSALPTLLYGAAAIVSALFFAYLQSHGFVNAFTDAKSHLLQSIQMVYSLTPGISQLGFWPPLLHVLLLPAIILLPHSVLLVAGAFITMLPLLLLGAHFLYGTCRECGVSARTSLLAPVLFLIHPFVQYFASSVMAELPLIVMVSGVAYFALRWSRTLSLLDLSLFGIFVSLASLARFEGFTLIPLSICFVVIRCWSLKMLWAQLQAIVLTFSFVALLGTLFIVLYSTVYAGSPLAFLSLGTERIGETASSLRPSRFSFDVLLYSLQRLYLASVHIHGQWLIAAFAAAIPIVLVVRRQWTEVVIVLFLFSPALFMLLTMMLGRSSISVPELPRIGNEGDPYGLFYNARFALTWVGASIVSIVLAIDALMRWRALRAVTVVLVIPAVVLAAVWHLSMVLFDNNFVVIRHDEQAFAAFSSDPGTSSSDWLSDYDGGRVLFTRFYSEERMLRSTVPLPAFVYEGNYRYFDQAVREPWLFARWVIVRHALPDQRGANVNTTKIFRIMLEMEAMPEFKHYYELVQETTFLRYYKLREHVLRDQAVSLGYDPMKIPSLNPSASWKPQTIYEELQTPRER